MEKSAPSPLGSPDQNSEEDEDIFEITDSAFPAGHRVSDSGSLTDSSDMSDGLEGGEEDDTEDLYDEDEIDEEEKVSDVDISVLEADEEVLTRSNNIGTKKASKPILKKPTSASSGSIWKEDNAAFIRDKMEPFCFPILFSDSKMILDFIKCDKSMIPTKLSRHMIWRCTKSTPSIIRDLASSAGFSLREKGNSWVTYWGKYPLGDQFKKLHAFQRINHFPASFHLGRKDSLCNNLMKMKRNVGKKVKNPFVHHFKTELFSRKSTFIQLRSYYHGIWVNLRGISDNHDTGL